ncbi:MAG: methionine--tRNA ligase [Verrucomicrobiota bacterium]
MFYITTAIDYVNGLPHLGHAYEKVLTDSLARYRRHREEKAFFLTGTDEHGQKVQKAAEKAGRDAQDFCDEMSGNFQALCKKLEISNDDFIRTTQKRHKDIVRGILADLHKKGEIYEGEYEGYYSTRQEQFLTEKEMVDGKFPEEYGEVARLKEKVWFFRMEKHQDWLKDYLKKNPDFIFPEFRQREVLGALENRIGDLCISRPKSRLAWGISLPFDEEQVTYVWFDALINYISAVGYGTAKFKEFWPAIHVIGKDILVPAHAIYWPTMLHACGVEMPAKIIAHGWWTQNKEKMSKSVGNVVDPLALVDVYGVDAFRYFVLREMSVGHDADFSREQFHQRYQSDLGNELGNLVNRVVSMIRRYREGKIPAREISARAPLDEDLEQKIAQALAGYRKNMESLQIHLALRELWSGFQRANQYVEETAPWKLAKDAAQAKRLDCVLAQMATSVAILSFELESIIPQTAAKIFSQLGFKEGKDEDFAQWSKQLEGKIVGDPVPLFPRIEC